MKKRFIDPQVQVVSFLFQERVMLEGYYDEDNADIGDVTPSESGAGGSDGWTDF